jgi:integrating conjugative element protein (TIGR03749 family)
VVLPVGKERMIGFPTAVSFGYDKSVLGDNLLSVQNNNGTLYLTARTAFTTQRVEVKCQDSGQIILLNLSAQANASNTPIDVVIAQTTTAAALSAPSATNTADNQTTTPSFTDDTPSYVELTRFAVQQLYAPKRLLIQPPNIYRTPMHTQKTIPLFLDGSVAAMPLASWRGGNLTVTAVLLRNQLKQPNTLDARNLCGSWQSASFFPQTVLAPAGQRQDSTTVFLVADRVFSDVMQTCLRGY